ncbi:MAG TPA: aquaporin [Acidimicrobiia bacterium]|nr:aquaporin [Acidimicrobiia bacterium]
MVVNKYLAEFFGTFILVFFGSMGILAVNGASGAAEIVAIGLGFGLALLAGIWAVGHVSGGHFNPAVTLAMLFDRRTSFADAVGYWVAQLAGASVASLVVMTATSRDDVAGTVTGYPVLSTGILMEVVLTTVFIWVILSVTRTGGNHAPLGIALTLVAVHIAGIPFSGASVNPARSFGPAVVSGSSEALEQLWVYIVFPLVGGLLAWGLHRLFAPVEGEDHPSDTIEASET